MPYYAARFRSSLYSKLMWWLIVIEIIQNQSAVIPNVYLTRSPKWISSCLATTDLSKPFQGVADFGSLFFLKYVG